MILERIKEYIDFKKLAISAFEKSIGMSNASFGKSLKNGGAIGTDKLENILSVYTDINPIWLLTGQGSMLRADESPVHSVSPSTDTPSSSASKPDESLLYNMYKDLQAEKKEKEDEIKELNARMLSMSEEIGRLKALLGEDGAGRREGLGKGAAKGASTRKPSSQPVRDVPSVGVPSGGSR